MKSGIYQIKNLETGRVYIGKSKNVERRWYEHTRELNKGSHYNSYLQRSFNKYGRTGFEFSVIEYCEESLLPKREEYWIEHHKTTLGKKMVYNTRFEKDGKLTEETLARLRKAGKASAEKQHKEKAGGLLYNFHTKTGVRFKSAKEAGIGGRGTNYLKGLVWFKGNPTAKDIKEATKKYEAYLKSQSSSSVVIVAKSLEEYWTFKSLRAAANFVYNEVNSTKNDMIKNAMDRDLLVPKKKKEYYIFSSIGELFYRLPKYVTSKPAREAQVHERTSEPRTRGRRGGEKRNL